MTPHFLHVRSWPSSEQFDELHAATPLPCHIPALRPKQITTRFIETLNAERVRPAPPDMFPHGSKKECVAMSFATLKDFIQAEDGAVTVDWVVLTAALVGLGLAVISVVSGGMQDLSTDISTALTNTEPLDDPFNLGD